MGKHLQDFHQGFVKGLLTAGISWRNIQRGLSEEFGRDLSKSSFMIAKLSSNSKIIKKKKLVAGK